MIDGAIFDLDGTLLDSMFIWNTIGEDYLRSIGYEPHENLCEVFKSLSLYQAACYYRSEYGVELSVEEIMNGVNEAVENYYFNVVEAKGGILKLLQELKLRGVKMCVATATDRYQAEAALKRCGIRNFFSEIFTCTDIGHGKDEPIIYREALEHLGTEKCKTAVFEDSPHALLTAKSDGFITVGIKDIYTENQDEVRLNSDFYLTAYSDLFEFWKFAESC